MKKQVWLFTTVLILFAVPLSTFGVFASQSPTTQEAQSSGTLVETTSLYEDGGFLPEGFHDYHEGDVPQWACQAGGWAVDPDDRTQTTQVEIVVDGVTVDTVPADQHRDDLAEADVCAGGGCSFEVSLWDLISAYEPHSVSVNAQDTSTGEWVQLSNSPKELTCRTYDIYVFDTQTGETKQLTTLTDTWEFNPRWSPNGKKIVHDRWLMDFAGGPSSNLGLHITDVNTGHTAPLLGGEHGNYGAWSPDGKLIAFSQDDVGVFVIPAQGGEARLLRADAFMPSWSNNGRRLAFQQPSDGSIRTMDLQGGDVRLVVGDAEAPAWSPDGLWLAYVSQGDIWKIPVDRSGSPSGDAVQITSDSAYEARPSWSNNGETIVYFAGYDDDFDIWRIHSWGGTPVRLTGGESFDDYDPNFSNNGRYIAYSGYMPLPPAPVPWFTVFHESEVVEGWDFPMNTTVDLQIDDPSTSDAVDYSTSGTVVPNEWDGGPWLWIDISAEFDVQPGFVVTLQDGRRKLQHVVENLGITSVDPSENTVSGLADPDKTIVLWSWEDPNGLRVVTTSDSGGNWYADFDDVGFNLQPGFHVRAEIWDRNGNDTAVDHYIVNPHFTIFPEWNYLEGYEWPEGAEVLVSVDGKTACSIGTTADYPEWDPNNTFFSLSFLEGCDIRIGDLISATDGMTTRTHRVEDIVVSGVDIEADTVFGTATFGTESSLLHIWIHERDDSYMELSRGNGAWSADFSSFDLIPGMGGRVEMVDVDGDATAIDWATPPVMGLRVNYGHDWVESFYEEGHEVSIRVTDSDGVEKGAATAFTGPRDDWGGESGFTTYDTGWVGEGTPDLLPGDWIYAEVDNGVMAQVRLGDIQGEVFISDDRIGGTVAAPWIVEDVQVECLDWRSGGDAGNQDGGSIAPDGSATYECSWDPSVWDVQPWQEIGVGYTTPDGNWIANAFHAEHWVAMWSYDPGPGTIEDGDLSYTFDWSYSEPEPGYSEITGPISVTVSSEAPVYDGYVLLRTNAAEPLLAWTGSSCEAVAAINPGQPVLFTLGWVNDYSMDIDDATAHFGSFEVSVSWDGPAAGSAALSQGPLEEWHGVGTSADYRCGLTGH